MKETDFPHSCLLGRWLSTSGWATDSTNMRSTQVSPREHWTHHAWSAKLNKARKQKPGSEPEPTLTHTERCAASQAPPQLCLTIENMVTPVFVRKVEQQRGRVRETRSSKCWFSPKRAWARPNPGARNSIVVSHMGSKSSCTRAVFHWLPKRIVWRQNRWDLNQRPSTGRGCPLDSDAPAVLFTLPNECVPFMVLLPLDQRCEPHVCFKILPPGSAVFFCHSLCFSEAT